MKSKAPRYSGRGWTTAIISSALIVLLAFILLAPNHSNARASTTATWTPPARCQTYAIFASGPSASHQSVHITGANSAGSGFQIVGGGIYGGDGGIIQNTRIGGDPLPTVDLVGGCTGRCSIDGIPDLNFNAQPQAIPQWYDIGDYQPGGKYATETGWAPGCNAPNSCGNYHYYDGDFNPPANTTLNGLYYVNGNVSLDGVSGNASVVATGRILIQHKTKLTTFDLRFPLLFALSDNVNTGAIHSSRPTLDLRGNLYAPNGAVNVSGAQGQLYGVIYGREVHWTASRANIYLDAGRQPDNPLQLRTGRCPY